jgi:hypothetical protein
MKIWLDDIRPVPEGFDFTWITNANDCIYLVQKNIISFISFDHDLGEGGTGYEVAQVIEKCAFFEEINPITWNIHSNNPVGRKDIEMAMKKAESFWIEHGKL